MVVCDCLCVVVNFQVLHMKFFVEIWCWQMKNHRMYLLNF